MSLLKRNRNYLFISIISFFWIFCFSFNKNIWVDELATIEFAISGGNIVQVVKNTLEGDPTVAPLFYILAHLWLKVISFNRISLRILPEIIVAISIFVIGKLGEKIGGKKIGIIAAIFTMGSVNYINFSAYSFRMYGLMFLFTTISIYLYILRLEYIDTKREWIYSILYGINLTLLCYSQYFGALICLSLGIFDLILILLKKLKLKKLYPYFIVVLIFFPYLLIAYQNTIDKWGAFWPAIPTYQSIITIFNILIPYSTVIKWFFLLGIINLIYSFILSKKEKNYQYIKERKYQLLLLEIIIIVLFTAFIYSKYINSTFSIWVDRYFVCLMPSTIIVSAIAIKNTFQYFFKEKKALIISWVMLLLCMFYHEAIELYNYNIYQPFEEASDYLKMQQDIYDQTTLVYVPIPCIEGWNYCVASKGKYPIFQSVGYYDNFPFIDLNNYETIYIVNFPAQITEVQIEELNKNFSGQIIENTLNIWKYTRDKSMESRTE